MISGVVCVALGVGAELLFATIKSVLKCKDSEAAEIMEMLVLPQISPEEEELMSKAVDENVLEEPWLLHRFEHQYVTMFAWRGEM